MTTLTNLMLALGPTIDVDVHKDGGHAWYTNPLYVGIGVVILLLAILISVTAAKKA